MKQVGEYDEFNNTIITKERVSNYFSTPGFLNLERMIQLQNELEINNSGISPQISPMASPNTSGKHNLSEVISSTQ